MKIGFLIFFVISTHSGFCTSHDSLEIKLVVASKEIIQVEDLQISLTIKSDMSPFLLLPDNESWGFLSSIESFYLIQIQKMSGDKYIDMPSGGHLDNVPTFSLDTVYNKQYRQLSFPIRILYSYTKGEYRIRVLCRFSMYNKLRDRYTDWVYFSCINDIAGTH
jgi:hypothetical protein